MECDEEVPDSFPSHSLCSDESTSLLSNLATIAYRGNCIDVITEKCEEGPPSVDTGSEETHLSDDDIQLASPVIPLQDGQLTSLSQSSNSLEEDGHAKVFLPQGMGSLEPQAQVPTGIVGVTRSILPINDASCRGKTPTDNQFLQIDIEIAEKKINAIEERICSHNYRMADPDITAEEDAIKELIKRIAFINKKEKEELILLRKQGVKVSKERLNSLVQHQRKLLSVVQQQAALTQKIKKMEDKHHHGDEEKMDDESSQSLLEIPGRSQSLVSEKQIRSILKQNSEKAKIGTPSQKKVVKFFIPQKQISCDTGNPEVPIQTKAATDVEIIERSAPLSTSPISTVTLLQKKQVKFVIPHKPIIINIRKSEPAMPAKLGMNVEAINQNVSCEKTCISPGQAKEIEDMEVSGNCEKQSIGSELTTNNTVVTSTVPTGSVPVDCSESQPLVGNTISSHDQCNESDDSISLISGVSGFEQRPQYPNRKHLFPTMKEPQTEKNDFAHKDVRSSCTVWSFNTPRISHEALIPSQHVTLGVNDLLNLTELIQKKLVIPGRDVMECLTKGQIHRASLLGDGSLLGPHGITFHSPMIWMRGISRLKQVTRSRAYKSICYKGRTLHDICLNAKKSGMSGSMLAEVCTNSQQHPVAGASREDSTIMVKTQESQLQTPDETKQAARCQSCKSMDLQYTCETGNELSPTTQDSMPQSLITLEQQKLLTTKHKVLLVQDDELFPLASIFNDIPWDSEGTPQNIHDLFL